MAKEGHGNGSGHPLSLLGRTRFELAPESGSTPGSTVDLDLDGEFIVFGKVRHPITELEHAGGLVFGSLGIRTDGENGSGGNGCAGLE